MLFMEWEESYSVGIPEFDGHHRHLFELLNKAYDASMLSKQREVFSDIVSELAEYIYYHFTAEEQLMERFSYPDLVAHRDEHTLFSRKITDCRKILSTSNDECTIDLVELTQFLMNWLTHHIIEVDKQYSHLLQSEKRA